MDRQPHVLAIAYPAQGHTGPLMKLSQLIADNGIKVTFVCPELIRNRVLTEVPANGEVQNQVNIVSIPEGFEPGDDRDDQAKLSEAMFTVMPTHFESLIRKMNLSDDKKVTCVLADPLVDWALEIANKLGIQATTFWPAFEVGAALMLHVPQLIQEGIVDQSGILLKTDKKINISPKLPAINAEDCIWSIRDDPMAQKVAFQLFSNAIEGIKVSNWLLCNSFYDLNPSAMDLFPNLLPIGPILSSKSKLGKSVVNFWEEDSSCLSWLDKQPARSVVYIALGSITVLTQHQFEELALGIELSGLPFLWVVRSDLTQGSIIQYPEGFLDTVANRGKIVKWAPQEQVLAHSSIACFLSHCGWNSTMEGLSMGSPFLCWPYFADQFLNRSYICNIWKVGLGLEAEDSGLISRHQIKTKLEKLLCDGEIIANSMRLKELAQKSASEGGSSMQNFKFFIDQIKH